MIFLRNKMPGLDNWMESVTPTRSHMQSSLNIQHNIQPLYFFFGTFLVIGHGQEVFRRKVRKVDVLLIVYTARRMGPGWWR